MGENVRDINPTIVETPFRSPQAERCNMVSKVARRLKLF